MLNTFYLHSDSYIYVYKQHLLYGTLTFLRYVLPVYKCNTEHYINFTFPTYIKGISLVNSFAII